MSIIEAVTDEKQFILGFVVLLIFGCFFLVLYWWMSAMVMMPFLLYLI